MIRIIIIDDQEHNRIICRSYLEERKDIVIVGESDNINDAYTLINACKPDLLLLDINLGENTGFDLLKQFQNPAFSVIFITAFEQFSLKAIKVGALDYLLKPIDEEEFHLAIDKFQHNNKVKINQIDLALESYKKPIEKLAIRTQEGIYIVWLKNLMYCKSDGSYTTFYLADNHKITVAKRMKDYEELLPNSLFFYTHQSYLVNSNFVTRLTKDDTLLLTNGIEIPVSFRKKEEVIKQLTKNN